MKDGEMLPLLWGFVEQKQPAQYYSLTGKMIKPVIKDLCSSWKIFDQAQSMADNGDINIANKAFSGFIDKCPQSELKPNAQFAEALTMGVMGKTSDSNQSVKIFINENPDHPLVKEAKLVMFEMK